MSTTGVCCNCRAVYPKGVGAPGLARYLQEANREVEVWLQVGPGMGSIAAGREGKALRMLEMVGCCQQLCKCRALPESLWGVRCGGYHVVLLQPLMTVAQVILHVC